MSRVLVTGGAGLIGTAVVRRLLADRSYRVRVADQREAPAWMHDRCDVITGDLRDLEVAREAVNGCERVIHLAAIVGGIANFHKLPYTLTEVNAALYNALYRAAIEHGVGRLVYCSSSMVFEQATVFPTPEEHVFECPMPRSAYGFSKLAGEVQTRAAGDEFGLNWTIVRPFNAYGPGEFPDNEPGIAHAVPDLIGKVLGGQRPLQIFGSGEQTRTLTHSRDIAGGIVTAMEHPAGANQDFNISARTEQTVAEIARSIWLACDKDPDGFELQHLPSFTVDVQRRWPDTTKAERLLGWKAQTGVEEGLRETVSWFRDEKVSPGSHDWSSGYGQRVRPR